MKRLALTTILLLSIFLSAHSQQVKINGFRHLKIFKDTATTPGIAVDTSKLILVYHAVSNDNFDATRPNKIMTVTGPLAFNENYTIPGYSGTVTFNIIGTQPITFNGIFTGTIPTTGIFIAHYTNTGGTLSWN